LNCDQQNHFVHKGLFRWNEGQEATGEDASFGPLELLHQFGIILDKYLIKREREVSKVSKNAVETPDNVS